MHVILLGTAAGGGFPQWNDAGPVARRAWELDPAAPRRTQSAIAIRGEAADRGWLLLNCSPDIRQQILANPALHPVSRAGATEGLRHSPISDVLVTNGDIDHIGGLLSLRERTPFRLWASASVHGILRSNPIFGVLAEDVVTRLPADLDQPLQIAGLTVTLFPVPGKVPLYLEGDQVEVGAETDAVVGVDITDPATGGRLCYLPGCAAMPDHLRRRLDGTDALLFDGTLWTDDEMVAAGVGAKTGRRMGHMPISGSGGTLEALAGLAVRHRIFVHLNTTNPVLLADSEQRRAVEAAGWTVGEDGMELRL